jgi:hypothetical protein
MTLISPRGAEVLRPLRKVPAATRPDLAVALCPCDSKVQFKFNNTQVCVDGYRFDFFISYFVDFITCLASSQFCVLFYTSSSVSAFAVNRTLAAFDGHQ